VGPLFHPRVYSNPTQIFSSVGAGFKSHPRVTRLVWIGSGAGSFFLEMVIKSVSLCFVLMSAGVGPFFYFVGLFKPGLFVFNPFFTNPMDN
jgi:hypothetical protein